MEVSIYFFDLLFHQRFTQDCSRVDSDDPVWCQPPPLDLLPLDKNLPRARSGSRTKMQCLQEKLRHRGKFRDVFVDDNESSSSRSFAVESGEREREEISYLLFYFIHLVRKMYSNSRCLREKRQNISYGNLTYCKYLQWSRLLNF